MITNLLVCLSIVIVFNVALVIIQRFDNTRAGKRYNKTTREYK